MKAVITGCRCFTVLLLSIKQYYFIEEGFMSQMNNKERVKAMLDFRSVGYPVVERYCTASSLYEHGEKIRTLYRSLDSEFCAPFDGPIPQPDPGNFDADGRYHVFATDGWGVEWEYRIFGHVGHPVKRPLDDWNALDGYKMPVFPVFIPGNSDCEKARAAVRASPYFYKGGWINIFETTHALRNFEDVFADIGERDENLLRLTDRLYQYIDRNVDYLIALGVDAVQFADDLGTSTSLLMSPACWREIYKPFYKAMTKKVHAAGIKCLFHSCGYIFPMLEDLKETGFDSVWPQIELYNLKELAAASRDLHLAVTIHPDRGDLMHFGSPDDIRRKMDEYTRYFRPQDGGSWFIVEIDSGCRYENVEAMVEFLRDARNADREHPQSD